MVSPDYGAGSSLPVTYFYKKNFIGPIGGMELKYNFNDKSNLGIGYSKSVNKREVNFNNQNTSISNFKISHINHFFQLLYERTFLREISGIKLQGWIILFKNEPTRN